jgi:tryptophan synthase alpha chain
MSRINSVLTKPGRKGLIAYVTVGYPDIETTLKVVPVLAENGCNIIELGIPFSDPLADGATIQRASFHALHNGITVTRCLEVAEQLNQKVDIPLVFMGYYNPVLKYGIPEFCHACNGAGVSGLIIPDLPPEEGSDLEKVSAKEGIDLIYLLAPTSTAERIKLVAQRSHGFIYLVSVTGVTGARDSLPVDLASFVNRVRQVARQPLCVGFGISTAAEARQVAAMADGVIVGSRIIQLMEADPSLTSVGEFVRELRDALDSVGK